MPLKDGSVTFTTHIHNKQSCDATLSPPFSGRKHLFCSEVGALTPAQLKTVYNVDTAPKPQLLMAYC